MLTQYQIVQSIPQGNTSFSFTAVRAFSRLSHIWLTFRQGGLPDIGGAGVVPAGPRSSQFLCPTAVVGNVGVAPALADGGAPSARLSIGPKYWPTPQPAGFGGGGIGEHFYQMQKALPSIPNITRDNYEQNAFSICFDLRKTPGDFTSALSTRSGDLVRIDLSNLTANLVTEVWCTLWAFSVVGIRESGVTLLT
jgi:hypothetical protein